MQFNDGIKISAAINQKSIKLTTTLILSLTNKLYRILLLYLTPIIEVSLSDELKKNIQRIKFVNCNKLLINNQFSDHK